MFQIPKVNEEKEHGVSYQLFFEMLCTRVEKLSTYDDTKSFTSLSYLSTRLYSNTTAAKKVVTNHNLIWKVWALYVASNNSFFKVTNQHIIITGFHKIILWAPDIRFSSLFATRNVLYGGTSATQRQKFHTDDVKSFRNPVRSADWSTE